MKPASSSKKTMLAECNATHFAVINHTKEAPDGETMKPIHCNDLQERFNTLTREKNLLQNRNNILRNTLRMVTEERDKLRYTQTCGRKLIHSRNVGKPHMVVLKWDWNSSYWQFQDQVDY